MGFGRGIIWFVVSVGFALGSYMMTSQGASERAKLQQVEANIVKTRKEIRTLETEFNTRANMAQLGEWNGSTLRLGAPSAEQYLASADQLASMDTMPAVQTNYVAVVPGGSTKVQPEPAVVQTASVQKPAATASATVPASLTVPAKSEIRNGGLAKVRTTQKVAMLDDALFDELKQRARIEKSSLR